MMASDSSTGGTPRKGVRIRTSVHDGRKYVKSSDLVKSKKVRQQMKQLRRKFG